MASKINYEYKRQPLIISPIYEVSATDIAGLLALFWAFPFFIFFSTFSPKWYTISAFQAVAWIIAGAIIGVTSAIIYTRRELCKLSKDYIVNLNWKNLILIILVPFLLFSLFGFFASRFIFSLTLIGLWISIYAWVFSILLTRYCLFRFYEKTENMRIMQSFLGGGFAVIPKPPKNNKYYGLQPQMIQEQYKHSAIKATGATAIYFAFFLFLLSYPFLFERLSVSAFQIVAWIVIGLIIGVISGTMFTRNQLCRLSINHQTEQNKKDRILLLVPFLVLLPIGIFAIWYVPNSALPGLLISLSSGLISTQAPRHILLRAYQKREKMRLMTNSFIGGFLGIAVIPKPPGNDLNR